MTNIGREINDLLRDLPETRSRRHLPSGRIKRILLTRKYKDQNIYNGLFYFNATKENNFDVF